MPQVHRRMNGHDRRMPFSAQQNRQQHGGEQAVKAHAEGGKSAHFLADLKGAGGAKAVCSQTDGKPPIFSAMLMAMGVVTDFGARERMDSAEAPSRLASAIAETTAVRDPASSATVNGRTIFRRCCQ